MGIGEEEFEKLRNQRAKRRKNTGMEAVRNRVKKEESKQENEKEFRFDVVLFGTDGGEEVPCRVKILAKNEEEAKNTAPKAAAESMGVKYYSRAEIKPVPSESP